MSKKDFESWTLSELEYALKCQKSEGIHTWGPGQCGHPARGSEFCAKCLQREIDRRRK